MHLVNRYRRCYCRRRTQRQDRDWYWQSSLLRRVVCDGEDGHRIGPSIHLISACITKRFVAHEQWHLHLYLLRAAAERLHVLALRRRWTDTFTLPSDRRSVLNARTVFEIGVDRFLPVRYAAHERR
jgi:hypothetical protein